ncbi:MAG: UDP-glucose/GDP-mannose dehydrogenase family protein [Methylacidiphilales bacterium]|nr:UDP-glucose/GDP-mannose dehydrogenase family protein [Candidatus Methylacidiphilales bacterium]MDW8349785.1 UDP-glucose/GDP-mannose dehydrogenase family protein [Verrucomicrobiae bacterium]
MKIAIIGSGYVGLTTGTCFADVGHHVICVDNNTQKIDSLRQGKIPIYEPGLEELIRKNVATGRLSFTTSIEEGVQNSLVIFIAVPTPPQPDGSVDLSYVEKVAREIAAVLTDYRVIVDKSTVPVKTGEKVAQTISRYNIHKAPFDVVSNPEFLREGSAVADLMNPDRIVIGADSERAIAIMQELYRPFHAPILITDLNSAELIKHASNSFLALKISYANALAEICERAGANIQMVVEGMGMDKRIGRAFLNAGIGYGGSCFPKDLSAFIAIAEDLGIDFKLLKEVAAINRRARDRFIDKVREALWVFREKRIGLLGLAFKGNTDDVRNSVAMEIAEILLKEGAHVQAYDPKGMQKAKEILPQLTYCTSAEDVAEKADCIIIATEWDEFRTLAWNKMKSRMIAPLVFDGRNLLDPQQMQQLGYHYTSVGR